MIQLTEIQVILLLVLTPCLNRINLKTDYCYWNMPPNSSMILICNSVDEKIMAFIIIVYCHSSKIPCLKSQSPPDDVTPEDNVPTMVSNSIF